MANVYAKNSADARAAKSFLHDLACVSGLRSNNQRSNGNGSLSISTFYSTTAQELCDEVLNRGFNDVDAAIRKLDGLQVSSDLTKARPKLKTWSADEIATALVYLAECLNLYWDDLNATQYELDAFKDTILGKKVAAYGRYTSVLQAQMANAPTSNIGTNKTTTSRTAGQPPKNNYKSTGPQSGNVRDLHGTPGQKVFAQGNTVFRIVGTIANSRNVASAFVRPLSPTGASGSTNKVFVNSGNGYTDCICWFDDINEVNSFYTKLVNNANIKSNITNLQIVKNKPDTNGYYLVGTEYGECAIAAKKLNEALGEAVEDISESIADADVLEEDNGWERVGARITKEEYEKLTQNMLKY